MGTSIVNAVPLPLNVVQACGFLKSDSAKALVSTEADVANAIRLLEGGKRKASAADSGAGSSGTMRQASISK